MIKITRHRAIRSMPLLLGMLLMVFYTPNMGADILQVAKPIISGTNYTFPIILDSDSADVAVMDFRFNYDPEVFRPIEAQAGAQADYSNKIVNANQSSPGEYIVVLWGPNQNTLNSGEVARIVLEHTGYESDNTQLAIAGLTMADPYGAEVSSSAQGIDMDMGGDSPPLEEVPPPSDGQTGAPPNPGDGTETPDVDKPENLADALGGILGIDAETEKNAKNTISNKNSDNPTPPGASQFPKTSDRAARLANLSKDAESLRNALPTPVQPEIEAGEIKEKVFTEKKKHDTIPTVPVKEDTVPDVKDIGNAKHDVILQAHVLESDEAGENARAGALADNAGQGGGAHWTFWAVVFTGTLIVGLSLSFLLRSKFVSK